MMDDAKRAKILRLTDKIREHIEDILDEVTVAQKRFKELEDAIDEEEGE